MHGRAATRNRGAHYPCPCLDRVKHRLQHCGLDYLRHAVRLQIDGRPGPQFDPDRSRLQGVMMKAGKSSRSSIWPFAVVAISLFCAPLLRAAAADEQCLVCHGEAGMKSDSGKSLHVDATKFKGSIHASLSCTTCHEGVKEYPHPKRMRLPSCTTCHDDPASQVPKSVHSILGADACASCHGKTHEIQAADKVAPQQCATCHDDAVHGYLAGVHAAARKNGEKQAPTCLACHGSPHQVL